MTEPHLPRRENCGTLIYMAPEVLLNQEYSFSVDIFAAGLLMFQMLEGRHPFFARGITNQYYVKLLTTTDPAPTRNWSKHGLSLFRRITRRDPLYRYTAAEALQHPWFQGDLLSASVPFSRQETQDYHLLSQQISAELWRALAADPPPQEDDDSYATKATRFIRKFEQVELAMTAKHLDELLGPYDFLAKKKQAQRSWINESHPRIVQLNQLYDNILYRKPMLSTFEQTCKDKQPEHPEQSLETSPTPEALPRPPLPLPEEQPRGKRNINESVRSRLKSVRKGCRNNARTSSILKASKRKVASMFRITK